MKRISIEDELRLGKRPQGAEITRADVGRPLGMLGSGWGKVLPVDVGKRVWRRDYGLTMENTEQRDAREAKRRR